MRYELKFIFNSLEIYQLKSWLIINTRFKKKFNNRLVNSIYFDDMNNSSANDNLIGISNREKYRLRWYDKKINKLAKFELKKRYNKLNHKEYFDFPLNFNENFNLKNIEFAKIFQNQLMLWDKKYYFDLFPKIQVQYKREYYEDVNNVRLTFDNKIKIWSALDYNYPFSGISYPYNVNIVELKFLPNSYSYVKELIKKTNFLPKRHSKYLAGLAILNEVQYI